MQTTLLSRDGSSSMPGAGMVPHFAGLAALGTRGRGPNAVWEGLVRRNEVPFRLPRYITMKTYRAQ